MKRDASLSLDLDNLWSYKKVHGDSDWSDFPSYLDVVVPRLLSTFQERNWHITFFIVGQDAALEKNRESLASIAAAGHEIGNHSFHHAPWLHTMDRAAIDREIAQSADAIETATGCSPIGFRGPGYSRSQTLIDVLIERRYAYDASTFATFIGPLARYYYLRTASAAAKASEERKELFGAFSEGFKSNRAHVGTDGLVEIPVTTLPLLRLPIHFSYMHYLDAFSPKLALAYLNFSLAACRLARLEPSLLLHPLDFLGAEDAPGLSFFPGMTTPRTKKLAAINAFLDVFAQWFTPMTMAQHAQRVRASALPAPSPLRTM